MASEPTNGKSLFRIFSFALGLARQRYTGTLELQWKDGEVKFVRTESGRTPEELPGEDAELVGLLEKAQSGTGTMQAQCGGCKRLVWNPGPLMLGPGERITDFRCADCR